jgi:hypothetical protein
MEHVEASSLEMQGNINCQLFLDCTAPVVLPCVDPTSTRSVGSSVQDAGEELGKTNLSAILLFAFLLQASDSEALLCAG